MYVKPQPELTKAELAGYLPIPMTNVDGYNINKWYDKTAAECIVQCNAVSECVGVEVFSYHGGTGTRPGFCQLSRALPVKGQNLGDGVKYNNDFLVKPTVRDVYAHPNDFTKVIEVDPVLAQRCYVLDDFKPMRSDVGGKAGQDFGQNWSGGAAVIRKVNLRAIDANAGTNTRAEWAARCCDECSRQEGCVIWAMPHLTPSTVGNECYLLNNLHDEGEYDPSWTSGLVDDDTWNALVATSPQSSTFTYFTDAYLNRASGFMETYPGVTSSVCVWMCNYTPNCEVGGR